jgi:hypothetical protein
MHRLAALFLVVFLIPSLGVADTLYKWVDAQGNVHYSDKPAPGATRINIPKAATFTPPQVAKPAAAGAGQNNQKAFSGYTAISIVSPQDQATVWNTTSVTVSVSLTPSLQKGDSVTIALDGAVQTVAGYAATFDNLDRGTHMITASIVGPTGTVNAPSVTFYIQRAVQSKPP